MNTMAVLAARRVRIPLLEQRAVDASLVVVDRGEPAREVRFADLWLPADREYRVFEFWDQQYLGTFKGAFTAPAMDTHTGMDVFAIREARSHPWILSTTRHLSQGGVSLRALSWDPERRVLAGRSAVVKDDPYAMTVHLPAGYRLTGAGVPGETVATEHQKEIATVRIMPSATRIVAWHLQFE